MNTKNLSLIATFAGSVAIAAIFTHFSGVAILVPGQSISIEHVLTVPLNMESEDSCADEEAAYLDVLSSQQECLASNADCSSLDIFINQEFDAWDACLNPTVII